MLRIDIIFLTSASILHFKKVLQIRQKSHWQQMFLRAYSEDAHLFFLGLYDENVILLC